MSRKLHSRRKGDSTARSLTAPSLFAAFSDQIQEELKRGSVRRSFQDGQLIQSRGEKTTGFYIIESGRVKIGRFASEGRFDVNLIMGPGDSFGELAVFGDFPRVADAVAVGETQMLFVKASTLDALLASDPALMRRILQNLAMQLQEALQAMVQQRKLDSVQQTSRLIASMCRGRGMPLSLAINQADIAEHLGLSRVTVAKILGRLEGEGLLKRGYGNITVYDSKALRNY